MTDQLDERGRDPLTVAICEKYELEVVCVLADEELAGCRMHREAVGVA